MNHSNHDPPHDSSRAASRTPEFVRLLTQHERRIYGYILSLVPRWADADEILQETNVRLWEQFGNFQTDADFGAWACTIAYYQVLTFRKRAQRERMQFGDSFVELVAAESAALVEEADVRLAALEACLNQLPAHQRRLLRACYSGQSTLKAAAEVLGKSVAATYKSLSRIRTLLHQCIERRLKVEGEL